MDLEKHTQIIVLNLLKHLITFEQYVRNVFTCKWSTRVSRHTSRVTIAFLFIFYTINTSHTQTIIKGGDVSGIWTPESSPYLIEGDINIPQDSVLLIEAGTLIEFQGHYELNVFGWLYANGNNSENISFTAADTSSGWAGLRFFNQVYPQNDSSLLMYCSLSYAKNLNKSGKGGAIYCKNSTRLILDNLDIYNCKADSGAGIFLQNSPIFISNSRIHDCFSDRGGGVFLHISSPTVRNLIIENNIGNVCGGISFYKSSGDFQNVQVLNNTSNAGGGGIVINRDCHPDFINCIFQDNNASGSGGGIAIIQSSDPIFKYCNITGNQTILDQYETLGGGIFITRFENYPQFINCIIDQNTSAGNGGGMYTGDEVNILNCQISNNIANTDEGIGGGGIYTAEGSIMIMNTTMVDNYGLKGENIYSNGSTIGLYNSIIWNNTSILQNHIYLSGFILPATFSCNYNNIQDGELSIDGEGTFIINYGNANINSDPLFESIIGENYNLTKFSPCISKGTLDTLSLFIQPLDLNRNARVVHNSIDLGAYEQQGGVWIESRVQKAECRIWPNPVWDVMNIEIEASEAEGSLSIVSLGGEILLHRNIAPGSKNIQLNLGHLKSGTYVLVLRFGGKMIFKRVVKV